jgi:type I restriction enzyme R subunit
MPLNEADTRAKLIDPAIHKCGWTEDLIRREETAGTVEIINGKARRRSRGKIDYVLRVKVNVDTQPVALALIEAKKESHPPGHGLDQAKGYAECRRHNVQFIFTSNGQRIAEVLRGQMASVEKARAPLQEELATINALPAALLRRAFSGVL